MATKAQSSYIADLTVLKTKEFKEVKELLVSAEIVKSTSDTVMGAQTIAEITNAMTDKQASKFIDLLIAAKPPKRDTVYAKPRIERTVALLDEIKATIADWGF